MVGKGSRYTGGNVLADRPPPQPEKVSSKKMKYEVVACLRVQVGAEQWGLVSMGSYAPSGGECGAAFSHRRCGRAGHEWGGRRREGRGGGGGAALRLAQGTAQQQRRGRRRFRDVDDGDEDDRGGVGGLDGRRRMPAARGSRCG